MTRSRALPILVFISAASLLLLVLSALPVQGVDFFFEHQDPAGDVMKYNATLNGTPSEDFEGLDIKWVTSDATGTDLVITMDLKAKEKFRVEDGTKYVFRILTSADNSTGYNITFRNGSTTLNAFTAEGNGSSEDISSLNIFQRDKGNEMMVITFPVDEYLGNISHFGLDAYSMKVTHNATYLDYISQLPGHPEYVSPDVADNENLPDTGGGGDGGEDDTNSLLGIAIGGVVCIVLIVVFAILLLAAATIVIVVMKMRK